MERKALQQGWGDVRSSMWPTGDSGAGVEGKFVLELLWFGAGTWGDIFAQAGALFHPQIEKNKARLVKQARGKSAFPGNSRKRVSGQRCQCTRCGRKAQ